MRVGLISSYPPRRCGIGAFTQSLWASLVSLNSEDASPIVVAMDTPAVPDLNYPPEVRFTVQRNNKRDYRQAASFLNSSNVDVVCIQHEYGLFGGEAGSLLFDLLRRLDRPVISTMHTVLSEPSDEYRRATEQLVELSTCIVVISEVAGRLLGEVYNIPPDQIAHIPHGVPDRPFLDPSYHKATYDMSGRRVVLTFGLLGPGKGLSTAIEAMAKVAADHPEVLYVIAGATHPEEKKKNGEQYRLSLQRKVQELGVTDHVAFVNRFLDDEELYEYIHAADIFVTPYPNREQISSGTLTYALALGKAIVSTNYYYAEELLAKDRGIVVPPGDPEAMAEAVSGLLADEVRRDTMRRRAYEAGRQLVWSQVAKKYTDVFESAASDFAPTARPVADPIPVRGGVLPDMKLDYVMLLTDDTGIFHHAACQAPEWEHGYCTDDNARALIIAIRNRHAMPFEAHTYITRYLTFLHNAQRSDGTFRNFLSHDRRWLERTGSEDCLGRSVWAAGFAVRHLDHKSHALLAKRIVERALPAVRNAASLRAKAYSMHGLADYLHVFGGARDVRNLLRRLAEDLVAAYRANARDDWQWFENILTYANGNLVFALLTAGQTLADDRWQDIALQALGFLDKQCWHNGHLRLIGNQGWYPRGGERAAYDQQPIDAAGMVRAYHAAYASTGASEYLDKLRGAFDWFLGGNDLGLPLAELELGACADGLERGGINPNHGAEATLAYLSALTFTQEVRD